MKLRVSEASSLLVLSHIQDITHKQMQEGEKRFERYLRGDVKDKK